jgi:hypothetical protein
VADYIEIPLSKGAVAIVDVKDADLANYKWSLVGNYARRYTRGSHKTRRTEWMHRVILERKMGRPLDKEEKTDHKDVNGLNNRRDNLRIATQTENQRHRHKHKNNKSGYKGVHLDKKSGKYRSVIRVNGRLIYLGYWFDTAAEAHEAYKRAALEYFGEFACFE